MDFFTAQYILDGITILLLIGILFEIERKKK